MGFTLAMLSKNPKSKTSCIGIFSVVENRVYVQTATSFVPYRATLVTNDGTVILSNCEQFLQELERQAKISQITYYYTIDEDMMSEYKALLMSTSS